MATKKEVMQKANDAYLGFVGLCKLLFGKEQIKKINQLKEGQPFFKEAQSIADEFEINWEQMTADESNEIMLTLLDDAYNSINTDKSFEFIVKVEVRERKAVKENVNE